MRWTWMIAIVGCGCSGGGGGGSRGTVALATSDTIGSVLTSGFASIGDGFRHEESAESLAIGECSSASSFVFPRTRDLGGNISISNGPESVVLQLYADADFYEGTASSPFVSGGTFDVTLPGPVLFEDSIVLPVPPASVSSGGAFVAGSPYTITWTPVGAEYVLVGLVSDEARVTCRTDDGGSFTIPGSETAVVAGAPIILATFTAANVTVLPFEDEEIEFVGLYSLLKYP